jgi:predicted N-acetyltransferase YhbS
MKIRPAADNELDAIQNLHRTAFTDAEGPEEGEAVATIARQLLEDPTARPRLSLVAEDRGELIGNIIFTSARLSGHPGLSCFILAPLAVTTTRQHQRVGTALIHQGLDNLRSLGAELVLVLGDPAYYSRTGFVANHGIEPPFLGPMQKYPDAWRAQALGNVPLDSLSGKLEVARSLSDPQLW